MKTFAKRVTPLLLTVLFIGNNSFADMGDDPLLTKVMSEFEYLSDQSEGVLEWDIDAWVGRDLSKIWVKSSGEVTRPFGSGSKVDVANIELLYSRAVFTTWDQQFGIRHDYQAGAERSARDWLSFGYIGTAPYFIHVDTRVFIGEDSSSQLLIELERKVMLSQEWVLTSELNILANGRSNRNFKEGSGFSEIEFSLRLGYESDGNRKFQPFVGMSGHQKLGGTKRFEKQEGKRSGNINVILGIHSWF
jgi:copper resistance protein B